MVSPKYCKIYRKTLTVALHIVLMATERLIMEYHVFIKNKLDLYGKVSKIEVLKSK